MKNIFFLILVSTLQVSANSFELRAPFTEASINMNQTIAGRLVIPPMVAESVYRAAIADDCENLKETIAEYSNQLGSEELTSLVKAPMPYSMKQVYEVEVQFPGERKIDLSNQGELLLEQKTQSLSWHWAGPDLLKGVLNPNDDVQIEESLSDLKVKFTRRDLFCAFIEGNLRFKQGYNIFWALSAQQGKRVNTNLKLLFQEIEPVLNLEKNDKLLAALTGQAINQVTRQTLFNADGKFRSIDYIWDLLFDGPDTLKKSEVWSSGLNGVYLQEGDYVFEIGALE